DAPGSTSDREGLPVVQPQEARTLRIDTGSAVPFFNTKLCRTFAPRGTVPKSWAGSAKRASAQAAAWADAASRQSDSPTAETRTTVSKTRRRIAASCLDPAPLDPFDRNRARPLPDRPRPRHEHSPESENAAGPSHDDDLLGGIGALPHR